MIFKQLSAYLIFLKKGGFFKIKITMLTIHKDKVDNKTLAWELVSSNIATHSNIQLYVYYYNYILL